MLNVEGYQNVYLLIGCLENKPQILGMWQNIRFPSSGGRLRKGEDDGRIEEEKRVPLGGTKEGFFREYGCGGSEKHRGVKLPPKEPLDSHMENLKEALEKIL